MATGIHGVADVSELVELFKPQGLYLKPIARINISVKLPQLKDPGQSISNWDLMERIKKMVHPIQFGSIKVAKSTIEFVRFEADVNNRETMTRVIKALDNSQLKVIGFYEVLKVKAAEAKSDFPSRHDWDSFFRDAKNMNELNAGERPDTIYFANLPCKWFFDLRQRAKESKEKEQPSEFVLRRVLETFGEVRCVDIPVVDPFRKDMTRTGLRQMGFSFGTDFVFEAYVQYVEYISFVKAMDALRGMKLVHIDEDGRATAAYVKIDFDRTKHLSDRSLRRRRLERERLIELERIREAEAEARRIAEEAERSAIEKEKSDRRRQREEKRRVKHLERKRIAEEQAIERKILQEERKILVAQRKLESIRLLTDVLRRIEEEKKKEEVERIEEELQDTITKELHEREKLQKEEDERRERLLIKHETVLRKKMAQKVREKEEKREEIRREELRKRVRSDQLRSTAAPSEQLLARRRRRFAPSPEPDQPSTSNGYRFGAHSDLNELPTWPEARRFQQRYPKRGHRRIRAPPKEKFIASYQSGSVIIPEEEWLMEAGLDLDDEEMQIYETSGKKARY